MSDDYARFNLLEAEKAQARLADAYDELARLRERETYLTQQSAGLATAIDVREAEIDRLRAELETERMRLAACGVIAMANTPETAAKARDRSNMAPEYWSASAGDVAAAVDREMSLRAELDTVRNDFNALQTALVGNTGASAILTASNLRAELSTAQATIAELRGRPLSTTFGVCYIDRGFKWDSENRQHIPQLRIDFEPVPASHPYDAKGWADRDALAAALAAAPQPQPAADQAERDAVDAARYRWLRGRDLDSIHLGGVFAGQTPANIVLNGDDLDAEIDAAIAADAAKETT